MVFLIRHRDSNPGQDIEEILCNLPTLQVNIGGGEQLLMSGAVTSGKNPPDVCKGNVSAPVVSLLSVLRTILETAKVPLTLEGLGGNFYDCC